MKHRSLSVWICLFVWGLTGCAYLKDRGNDLADIVHIKLTAGNGVDVSARALWFAVGGGGGESYAIGSAYRGVGIFKSHRTDLQFIAPFINNEDQFEIISGSIRRYGVGDPGLLLYREDGSAQVAFSKYFAEETYESYLRVGATVQLLIGVDAEVRPVELLDFVVGIFTLDFRHDDSGRYTTIHEPPPEPPVEEPPVEEKPSNALDPSEPIHWE